jgi:hypothetical protein
LASGRIPGTAGRNGALLLLQDPSSRVHDSSRKCISFQRSNGNKSNQIGGQIQPTLGYSSNMSKWNPRHWHLFDQV